jgi:hypothetical protein
MNLAIAHNLYVHLRDDDGKYPAGGARHWMNADPDYRKPLWQLLGLKSKQQFNLRCIPAAQPFNLEVTGLPLIRHQVTPRQINNRGICRVDIELMLLSNDAALLELETLARRMRDLLDQRTLFNVTAPDSMARYNFIIHFAQELAAEPTPLHNVYMKVLQFDARVGTFRAPNGAQKF